MARPKNGFRTASKECYQKFCDKNPQLTVSFEDYKKILYTYNENLINYCLETGEKIKFPYGLGELIISKYKQSKYRRDRDGVEKINLSIDWVESKKAGKHIYLLNAHTDGYKFCWMWNWWKSRLKHAYIWKFGIARVHSRKLAVYLKKPNALYKDLYKEHKRVR